MKARHHSFARPSTGRRPYFPVVTLLFLVTTLLLAACGDFTPTAANPASPSPVAPTSTTNATLTAPAQSPAATTTRAGLTATPFATTTPAGPTPQPVELPGGLQNRFSLPAYPGHVYSIQAEALSPDQQYVATGGVDGTIRLWNTGKTDPDKAGKMLAAMTGYTSNIGSLAFSPDGKLLASGGGYSGGNGADYVVRLWEVPSGKSGAVLKGHTERINDLKFSPDGKTLATASSDGTIKLGDLATSKIKNTLKSRSSIIAFSPDGKTLAGGDYDVTSSSKGSYILKFWDVATGQETSSIKMPEGSVDIAFSPDGKLVAASIGNATWTGYQTFIGFYEIASGQEKGKITLGKYGIRHLAFSPDGKTLLGGGFESMGGPTISPFDGEPLDIYSITDLQGPTEGVARLWDVSGGTELKSWTTKDSGLDLVGFDAAGQPLAIGAQGNSAYLWNLTSGKQQAGFEGTPAIRSLAYSSDGQWLASGQDDGTIHLRQAASGREVAVLQGHKGQIASLAFSPDSKMLASGGFDYQIKLWNLATLPGNPPQATATLGGHRSWVNALSFSPDGKLLASVSSDSLVKLWDTASGKEKFTLKSHPYSVWAVAFTPDGRTLVSAGKTYYKGNGKTSPDDQNAIKLWDVATGKLKSTLGETVAVSALALSPDGKILAETTVSDYDNPGKLKFWDMTGGRQLAVLDLPDSREHSSGDIAGSQFFLAFTPNGKTLVGAQMNAGITFWQLDANKTSAKQVFHQAATPPDSLYTMALSPDGQTLAAGYADASLKAWFLVDKSPPSNPANPAPSPAPALVPANPVPTVTAAPPGPAKPLAFSQKYTIPPLSGHSAIVHQAAFNPDGKYLFSADGHGLIIQWDLASHQQVKSFHSYQGYMALSPDGKTLAASGANNDVLVWDVTSGKQLYDLKGPQDMVKSLAFSPDGKTLAAGIGNYSDSKDNSIRLWQLSDGKEIRRFDGNPKAVYYVAFTPDGQTLVSGTYGGVVKVWDVATGKEKAELQNPQYEQMLGLAYSPDGKTLAALDYLGSITTWDTQTYTQKKRIAGHMYSGTMAFSPDGQYIVTGDENGNGVGEEQLIRFWSLDGKQVKTLPGSGLGVEGLVFSPDGKYLAHGSEVGVSTPGDSYVYLWDVAAGKQAYVFKGSGGGTWILYVSPDSQTFLAGVGDYNVKKFEVATGKELGSIDLPFLGNSTQAVSPDGKILAVMSDKVIHLYDTTTGQEKNTIYGQSVDRSILRFTPDGKWLASVDELKNNLKIHFWDINSTNSEEAGSLTTDKGFDIFSPVVFSPDGRQLATFTRSNDENSGNAVIRVFDLATSQQVAEFTGHTHMYVFGLKFSPDGKFLVSAAWDNTIRLWDIAGKKEVMTIKDVKYGGNAVGFSPDGKSLVTLTDDNYLEQWSIPDGKVLLRQPLKGDDLAFSPDGKFMLVSSYDGDITAYEMK